MTRNEWRNTTNALLAELRPYLSREATSHVSTFIEMADDEFHKVNHRKREAQEMARRVSRGLKIRP